MTETPYRRGCALVVIAVFVFRVWSLSQWSWFVDDWIWFRDLENESFGTFVFQGYNSHFMPGQFVVMWVIGHLDPLNFAYAVAIISVLSATGLVAWALALAEIFGERAHLAFVLVVLGFTPVMTGVTLWWAGSLPTVVMQNVTGLTLWFLARWMNRGQHRTEMVRIAITYAVGLFFWEKVLLAAIPLGFAAIWMGHGTLRQRLRVGLRALWPVVLIGGGYVVLYGSLAATGALGEDQSSAQARTLDETASFYFHAFFDMLLPALVGGPFQEISRPGDFYPASSPTQVVMLSLLAVALVALVVRRGRTGAWALLMVLTYAAVTWGLVLFNRRYVFFENDAARVPHYLPDILAVLVLAVVCLTHPLRTESETGDERGSTRESTRDATPWSPRSMNVTSHAFAAVALVCLIGTGRAFAALAPSSPAPYFDALRHDAERVGQASVRNTPAPENLVGSIILPGDGRIDSLLDPLDLELGIDQPTPRFLMVNDEGRLMVARLQDGAIKNLPTDPSAACGYPVESGKTTVVPLEKELFPFGWVVEVTYFAQEDMQVTVRTDETSWEDVTFPSSGADAGIATMQFAVEGPVSEVELDGVDRDNALCVTEVAVGQLEPTFERPGSLSRSSKDAPKTADPGVS